MPRRGDIDPVDIPALLPNLLLIDVEPEPLRFRYRLVGTRIVSYRQSLQVPDHTGRYVDDVAHHFGADQVIQQFANCVRSRGPVLCSGRFTFDSGASGGWERLTLPLSEDDGRVTMLLVFFTRFQVPARARAAMLEPAR